MSHTKESLRKLKSLCYLTLGGSVAYQYIYFKKDFNGYFEKVLQPLSQYLNPEWAHKLSVAAIKYSIFPFDDKKDPEVLKTKFLNNYELSNPIGIAAGFDKHGDAVIGLRKLGFSIVEIGSITPEPQPGNTKPRVFRLPEDKAVINRYGFNSEGHDVVYKKLHNIQKTHLNGVLGINLGKNKISIDAKKDYVLGIQKFSNIADYFVINISSPNTPGLRSLQSKSELQELLTEINKARASMGNDKNPPLFLKLAPDLSHDEMKDIVSVIFKKECIVDGLIISNTTIDRSALVNKEFINETGGLSGKPLTNKSTEMIKEMYKLTKGKIPIIGVGGVFTGQDAYDKILAGASVVQLYTAFIYHGPPVISKIKNELAELLINGGYNNVNEAVGKGVKI